MKQIIVLIFLVLSLLNGQITLEQTYSNGQIYYAKLKNSGEKYYLIDKSIPAIKIYNLDHSVYKILNIPVAYDGYSPQSAYLVSEGLFTTDSKVGALIIFANSASNYKSRVITWDTSSDLLLEINNCNYASVTQTQQGAKLISNEYTISGGSVNYSSRVYALPGSLPASIAESINIPARIYIGQSYPNPVNGTTTIPYEMPEGEVEGSLTVYNSLGQEVLNLKVDNNFRDLKLSSDQLSAGTYIYQLKAGLKTSVAKRFTVAK